MNEDIARKISDFFLEFPERHYAKGEVLIQADEVPVSIFHLTQGRVKQYDISTKGEEIVLNVFKPPAFFPMSIALNPEPSRYIFAAAEPTQAIVAPVNDVLDFLKSNPDVTLDLLARVYRGTDGLLGRLAQTMSGNARSRLVYELLIQTRRFGKLHPQGIALPVNETALAARTGLSRETVSREISRLRQESIVTRNQGTIFVLQDDALKDILDQTLRQPE